MHLYTYTHTWTKGYYIWELNHVASSDNLWRWSHNKSHEACVWYMVIIYLLNELAIVSTHQTKHNRQDNIRYTWRHKHKHRFIWPSFLLDGQNKSRHRPITKLALPNALILWSSNNIPKPSDRNRSVQILSDLSDDPISSGSPCMHPPHHVGFVVPFSNDQWSKPNYDIRKQIIWRRRRGASDEWNQMVAMAWWAVKPPLQIWGQKAMHCVCVFGD